MKKILILLCGVLLAGGCASGGVSQEEYESIAAERDFYKEQLEALLSESEEVTDETAEIEDKVSDKQSMKSPNLSSSDLLEQISADEYSYASSSGTTWYFLEVTNNSPVAVSIETNIIGKDSVGNVIGAVSGGVNIIESGYSACILHMFDGSEPTTFEYTISVSEETWYKPVQSDLTYEFSDTGDKVIVTCTNTGSEPAEFVEGLMLFFSGDTLIEHSSNYFTDDDFELKPENTLVKEFECYSDVSYDNYKFFLNGRR